MTVAGPVPAAPPRFARLAAELPLVVVAVLLLSTGADFLPGDSLVGVGEVELNLARLLLVVGLGAFVYSEGLRAGHFRAGVALPIALLLIVGLVASAKWDTWARYRFLVEGVSLFYLTFGVLRARPESRGPLLIVAFIAMSLAALPAVAQVSQNEATGFYRQGCVPVTRTGAIPPDSLTRAVGTFLNPNVLAGHLLLLAPLGLLAVGAPRLGQHRLALLIPVVLAYVAVFFTYSRAAVLMGLVALGVGILFTRGARRLPLLAVTAAVLIGSLLLVSSCGGDSTAGFGRKQEWSETLAVIRENPVYGVGLGRTGDVLHARDARSSARHAHNLFLTWWADAGTGALLAWLALVAVLLVRAARAALGGSAPARAGLVALTGFVGFSMLDHPANVDRVALAFWVVAAFTAAVSLGPSRAEPQAQPERRS